MTSSIVRAWLALLALLAAGGVWAGGGEAITGPGDYAFTLQHGGKTRLYRVHVPPGFSPSRPMPVVLSLHGGGGNMDLQADDRFYGQVSKSDQAGFVVVFPNGDSRFRRGRLATWNAGNCCGLARDEEADDVGFIREIVARLRAQPGIDPKRFYVNGMSNGGMMSYRLACEMPEVFRAIASVAGTDNTRSCSPKLPVSVLHIHARDDERVLFNGGAGRPSAQVTDYVSVPDTVAKWVRLNGCKPTPRRVLEKEGAYCDAYTSCRDDTEVKLCVTAQGGHSWPGGTKPRGGAPGSTALSATDVIWEFFSAH
ncbi:MAG: prolyl oligopeptidase family serine peptidase [Rhizobacter sp.]|nr:prolyl oligopeptidase family serine peptidase [Rhizobacter sp.]